MKRIFTAFAMLALVGCSASDSNSSGYQPGALGNGGFLFNCDSVATSCSHFSNDANKFPKAVAVSSTFSVRFVPKSDTSGIQIHFNESAPDKGITVESVGDYITTGPSGLTAVKLGFATLASKDAAGQLVDYTTIRIVKPDTLVVYPASTSAAPTPVAKVTLSLASSDLKSYQAFARSGAEELAGKLQIDWASSDPTTFDVNVSAAGATLTAKKAGNATLRVTGATFLQEIPVEVQP
jgi:hypothetical protein